MSTAGRYPIRTPRAYAFDAAYATVPNWDIGRPQRSFAYLADADLVRSPVLEVGCGTGELSMFLARRGHTVLGIDIALNAIEQARSKAHWRRIPAEFLLWDALDLGGLADAGFSFATVVDCAMFHIFSDEERERAGRSCSSTKPFSNVGTPPILRTSRGLGNANAERTDSRMGK